MNSHSPQKIQKIRAQLHALKDSTARNEFFFRDDPILWIDSSLHDQDKEILSFILSGLSYGRVEQIKTDYFKLLEIFDTCLGTQVGSGIFQSIASFSSSPQLKKTLVRKLKTWRHRLNTGNDILLLIGKLYEFYKKYPSLDFFFRTKNEKERIEIGLQKMSFISVLQILIQGQSGNGKAQGQVGGFQTLLTEAHANAY